jgi:hypothetical protein
MPCTVTRTVGSNPTISACKSLIRQMLCRSFCDWHLAFFCSNRPCTNRCTNPGGQVSGTGRPATRHPCTNRSSLEAFSPCLQANRLPFLRSNQIRRHSRLDRLTPQIFRPGVKNRAVEDDAQSCPSEHCAVAESDRPLVQLVEIRRVLKRVDPQALRGQGKRFGHACIVSALRNRTLCAGGPAKLAATTGG